MVPSRCVPFGYRVANWLNRPFDGPWKLLEEVWLATKLLERAGGTSNLSMIHPSCAIALS